MAMTPCGNASARYIINIMAGMDIVASQINYTTMALI